MDSTARLHVAAKDYDDLVSEAATRHLVRLHTALFLSRRMGHRTHGGLAWEVSFGSAV